MSYCVTANGNIVAIETPAGHPMITDSAEGYGICDATTGKDYHDYAQFGDSGNWNPATVVSSSTKAVKIARTTKDGLFTLTQTISLVPGATSASARITMALITTAPSQKSVPSPLRGCGCRRRSANNVDGTVNSAFGWNSISSGRPGAPFGLVLQNAGQLVGPAFGYAQDTFGPPNPCAPFANNIPGLQRSIDGSLVMLYEVGMAQAATVILTATYKGM
jgi:hypothetical protein